MATMKTYIVTFTSKGFGVKFDAKVKAFSTDDAEGLFAGMRQTHTVFAKEFYDWSEPMVCNNTLPWED